jgi:quercetin dioxygenase-like cupin family protein
MSRTTAVVLAGVALLLGLALGAALTPAPRSERLQGGGRLDTLPAGPVEVVAETVELPAGFVSRHEHGGPTFNLIRRGRVEIDDRGGTTTYGPGGFFFEPGDTPHEIRVRTDARLDVVRLLPPGAHATTELR